MMNFGPIRTLLVKSSITVCMNIFSCSRWHCCKIARALHHKTAMLSNVDRVESTNIRYSNVDCKSRRAGSFSQPESSARVAYDSGESLAYAAARLPGCHAVAWRVFSELRVRLPHFSPTSMLDFGAGPGTAIWAASDVSNYGIQAIRTSISS